MTLEQLIKAVPKLSRKRAEIYYPFLIEGFTKRGFNKRQIAHFLAQVGHESLSFFYTREIWGPTPAQIRYEGRKDLGNVNPGDGKKFMGRGLIQITGSFNYKACSLALYGNEWLLVVPSILEQPEHAVASAFWFWDKNKLAGIDDVNILTRKINGGTNGLTDRLNRFEIALQSL